MIKNYFKIAWRNLAKNKIYSGINIFGLAVGVLCVVYITLFIIDETSYDVYHENADRIYRVAGKYDQGGGEVNQSAVTTYLLGPQIEVEFPQVEHVVRIDPNYSQVIKYKDDLYRQPGIMYADSGFFKMFSFEIKEGRRKSIFAGDNVAVISEPLARKYFKTESAVGKTIEIDEIPVEIVAVMESMPRTSHFHSDLVVSMATIENQYPDWVRTDWSGTSHYTYLQLSEQAHPGKIESQLNETWDKNISDLSDSHGFFLQPLTDIHLRSHLSSEIEANGDITNVYIFGLVGLIVLFMACMNYMNLATVRSIERYREVGVRKVLGAGTRHIRFQFFGESILTTGAAVISGLLMAELLIPFVNYLTGKAYTINWEYGFYWIIGLLLLTIVIGILSGIYPAMLLSKFNTSETLKGKNANAGPGANMIRKGLVTMQFAVSIAILISTAVIYKQLNYVKEKKLGINPSEVVIVPFQTSEVRDQYDALRGRLLSNTAVMDVTATNNQFTNRVSHWREYEIEGKNEPVVLPTMIVEHHFFELLQAEFRMGRGFSEEFTTDDTEAYVINESAVQLLGLDDPIGTKVDGRIFTGREWNNKKARIIGVVKDFHLSSLHDEIQPVVYSLSTEKTYPLSYMAVRLKSDQLTTGIEYMQQVWSEFTSEYPFDFSFMDQQVQQFYEKDKRFLSMFGAFTVVAILIACMGVFGLAAFTATRRRKEVGIRRILGATSSGIVWLLSKEYVRLVILANLVAWPVAWWFARSWLQDFAYHVNLSAVEFISMGVTALVIIVLTVGYHGLKAARMNPVKNLRSE